MNFGLAAFAVLAGSVAGLGAAVVWLILDIPSRVMHIFGVRGAKRCGWSLLAGIVFGAFMPLAGYTLPLGHVAGVLTMLLGGTMTGMMASALAEIVDVVPQFLFRFRLVKATGALCWSMAMGKAAGAFIASFWTLW